MPLRSDWSHSTCSIAHAADVLADPWVLLVLRELFSHRTGFDEIRDATGAADSVLARRLRTLAEHGLVVRRVGGGYDLTEAGRATLPILHAYARFTAATDPDGPWGLRIACALCGSEAVTADWCPACAAPLTAETTTWSRPSMGGEPFRLVAEVAA
ncbi:winged helix-turn-helix transcriptional regulator [Microbacterium gorillae]|uniref:winged helix-turn-helix transcriptional regulator n=1 Tax=Microbacterium gorillae TaxID=1231063 RepID=UPI0005915BA8|nr:helix-turn-helix domain-containing protein [Microbacterium gorillae]